MLFSRGNGKHLEFFKDENHPDSLESLNFFKILLSREFQPLKSIRVERVNSHPVSESPYKELLKQAGFRDNYLVFILDRYS